MDYSISSNFNNLSIKWGKKRKKKLNSLVILCRFFSFGMSLSLSYCVHKWKISKGVFINLDRSHLDNFAVSTFITTLSLWRLSSFFQSHVFSLFYFEFLLWIDVFSVFSFLIFGFLYCSSCFFCDIIKFCRLLFWCIYSPIYNNTCSNHATPLFFLHHWS